MARRYSRRPRIKPVLAGLLSGSLLFGGCDPTGPDEKQPDDRAPRFIERVMDYDAASSELFVRLSASDDNASTLDYACNGDVVGSRSVAPGVVVEFRAPYAQGRSSQQVSADCSVDDGVNTPVSTSLNATIDGLPDAAPVASLEDIVAVSRGDPTVISFDVLDDFGVDSARISFGDGEHEKVTSFPGSVSHTYGSVGDFTVTLTGYDDAGQQGVATAVASVTQPDYSVSLAMRGFLSRAANTTALVTFRDDASGAEYSAQPDASGALSIDLPAASYTVLIDDADDTELHRTNLGGSCQVTDYDDEPIRIDLTRDLSGIVETVEQEANLAGMAEQWTPEAATARVGPQLTVAVYTGPESPDDPQTVPLEPSEIENIRTYFNEHMALFEREGDICGGNPFNVQLVVAGPDQITNYAHVISGGLRAKSNVQIIRGAVNAEEGELITADTIESRVVQVIERASIDNRFLYPRSASNESTFYGSGQESIEECSIRDDERFPVASCDYSVTFTLNDRNWNQIVSGYVARAQQQGFNPRIVPPE